MTIASLPSTDTPAAFPVWQRWTAAIDPETVFAAIHGASPTAFWLDSSRVVAGLSRFSLMGDLAHPAAHRLEYRHAAKEVTVHAAEPQAVPVASLFDYLRQRLRANRVAPEPALPFDFCGGFVGVLGYELKAECGGRARHASALPDACLLYVENFVAFDHATGEIYAVALAHEDDPAPARRWVADMRERIDRLLPGTGEVPLGRASHPARFVLETPREDYLRDISRCLRKIRDGESYEICLTNRLRARADVDPLALYRLLRRRNPAPCAAYLRLPDAAVLCSSPERFLAVSRDRVAEMRPIKGTAARCPEPVADRASADALRRCEKERAENLMIVDLARNDLNRVCLPGSVHVPALMAIESYATVHQLVSTVQGRLRPECDAIDAVHAAYPPGSMTGAPKLRTMEIIDELEAAARGFYAGALGYLSLNGTADLNVVIRTIVARDGELTIGAGGAVVASSDPHGELDEMLLKADVLVRAVAEHLGAAVDASEGAACAAPS